VPVRNSVLRISVELADVGKIQAAFLNESRERRCLSRRMKELGIRMALGAGKIQVLRALVGRPMVVLGLGSVMGLLSGLLSSEAWDTERL
jgi:hypothetical protein